MRHREIDAVDVRLLDCIQVVVLYLRTTIRRNDERNRAFTNANACAIFALNKSVALEFNNLTTTGQPARIGDVVLRRLDDGVLEAGYVLLLCMCDRKRK